MMCLLAQRFLLPYVKTANNLSLFLFIEEKAGASEKAVYDHRLRETKHPKIVQRQFRYKFRNFPIEQSIKSAVLNLLVIMGSFLYFPHICGQGY